jgi:hypothetical protein
MRWKDLEPEPSILRAIERAGERREDSSQDLKRNWSEKFADACAFAVASELRNSAVNEKRILPEAIDKGSEPLTPLSKKASKRIDVTVSDSMLGLEIGVSLKGLNFRDARSGNYDKNLTGRLYELGDEVRMVHEHLPHAFMVGVFFLPVDSVADKSEGADSSFARTVLKLRTRTGRIDPNLAGLASKCDASFVALYSLGPESWGIKKGACRFFDVTCNPPRSGRPKICDTLSLKEFVDRFVSQAISSTVIEWAEPESD